jgi:CheY-like chemotaxis protein
MRLDRLTPAHVRRAVQVFLDHAWPAEQDARPKLGLGALEDCSTLDEVFARFDRPAKGQTRSARYTLRLGNYRYPFMKLVVQEYLVNGEYFFSVDTHDDLCITPDMPDYEGWTGLRGYNRELKDEIENAWQREGLPTNEDLRHLMEGIAQLERDGHKSQRLLVVDDEQDVCRGVAAVLEARGYSVEVAFDGRQVLDRMQREPCPDLLLLDYSMPELDGEQVMTRLRADPRFADLPILLATATSIDLSTIQRASGLLRKPYPREVLFAMIRELLGGPEGAGTRPEA